MFCASTKSSPWMMPPSAGFTPPVRAHVRTNQPQGRARSGLSQPARGSRPAGGKAIELEQLQELQVGLIFERFSAEVCCLLSLGLGQGKRGPRRAPQRRQVSMPGGFILPAPKSRQNLCRRGESVNTNTNTHTHTQKQKEQAGTNATLNLAAVASIIPVCRPPFCRIPPGMRSVHLYKCRGDDAEGLLCSGELGHHALRGTESRPLQRKRSRPSLRCHPTGRLPFRVQYHLIFAALMRGGEGQGARQARGRRAHGRARPVRVERVGPSVVHDGLWHGHEARSRGARAWSFLLRKPCEEAGGVRGRTMVAAAVLW